MQRARATRASRCATIEGLDVLDERFVGRPGVFAYDPLRLASTCAGSAVDRLRARADAARDRRRQPRAVRAERDRRRCSAWASAALARRAPGGCVQCAASTGRARGWASIPGGGRRSFAPPPPWGELVMTPARGVLRRRRRSCPPTEAVGRIAAESLADVPARHPQRAPGRAPDRGDARLHPADARAGRQRPRRQRPACCARVRVVVE